MLTKVKPNINSVKVHPQLSNNGHPVDDALTSIFEFPGGDVSFGPTS